MTTPPMPRRLVTPSVAVAGMVTLVALVLAAATLASELLLSIALGVCVVALAWGWAGLLNLPTPRGTVGTITAGGLAIVLAVATRDLHGWFGLVPAALALAMIGAFTHQILRRDGRPRVVESVSAVVLALAVVTAGALMLIMASTAVGTALVLGSLAAAVASSWSDLLGRWPALEQWLTAAAMVAGAIGAILVAVSLSGLWTTWLLVGVAAGALSHAMRRILCHLPTMAHARPRLTSAVASVLVTGVVPYLVALALLPEAIPG